ncbi:MAG: tetratricopeptide repeat protein [Chlorobi bacterium]|nr:tetratricopeptide repeat protein [Chlorobiota bacterium]
MHARSVTLRLAFGVLVLAACGCRAVGPVSKEKQAPTQASTTAELSKPSTAETQSDTVQSRLLPLRAYMDDIARRQVTIENRLDTIEVHLAALRRMLETTRSSKSLDSISSEPDVVRGKEPPLPRTTPGALPRLPPKPGLILPDSGDGTVETRTQPIRSQRRLAEPSHSPKRGGEQVAPRRKNEQLPLPLPSAQRHKQRQGGDQLFDSAMINFRSKKYTAAIDYLGRLLEQSSPYSGEYLYWRGLSYFMLSQYNRAAEDVESALARLRGSNSPRAADTHYLLAEIAAAQGDVERAKQLLRSLLERYPHTEAAILARRKLQQLML